MWWRKLGEVENECTSHILGSFPIFLPKIIKIGGNLTKSWQKQICLVFLGHGVYSRVQLQSLLPIRIMSTSQEVWSFLCGTEESQDASVWQVYSFSGFREAVGWDVMTHDAFRIGKLSSRLVRPILRKLHSSHDRKAAITGSGFEGCSNGSLSALSCTGWTFLDASSISLEWPSTGVFKPGSLSTSWTAAHPVSYTHLTLPTNREV